MKKKQKLKEETWADIFRSYVDKHTLAGAMAALKGEYVISK